LDHPPLLGRRPDQGRLDHLSRDAGRAAVQVEAAEELELGHPDVVSLGFAPLGRDLGYAPGVRVQRVGQQAVVHQQG